MKIKAIPIRPATLELAIQCHCVKVLDRIDCYHVKDWPMYPFCVSRSGDDLTLHFGHIAHPESSLPQGLLLKLEQLEASLKLWNYLNQSELVVRFSYYDVVEEGG